MTQPDSARLPAPTVPAPTVPDPTVPDPTVSAPTGRQKIVIVGGGFGGVYTAIALDRMAARGEPVEVTLVSRDNFFLMTPLLFEAGSGTLEPRHAVNPIRPLLRETRFVEARVTAVDVAAKVVHAEQEGEPTGATLDLPYDHLVVAVGGVTNTSLVPGGDTALTFKTLADGIRLRNHVIGLFEKAAVEPDPARRAALLTIVVIGGGLVGVELAGELTEFLPDVAGNYRGIRPSDLRLVLIESGPSIMPEVEKPLREYAAKVLRKRHVDVRTGVKVRRVEPDKVVLPAADGGSDGEVIPSMTIVVATGVTPSPLVATLPLEKDKRGRIVTDSAMLAKGRADVWSLGDCAAIPDPNDEDGKPYPQLAQHALREARQLARNLAAVARGEPPKPFDYKTLGVMAALGRGRGVGKLWKFHVYGLPAWLAWRGYYLMQMPQWSRRVRIFLDWTVNLVFRTDVAKLDASPPEAAAAEKR